MKKIVSILTVVLLLASACSTDDLILLNPNSPSEATLASEDGIKAFALGLLEKSFGYRNNLEGGNSAMFMAMGHHMIMGDDIYIPWGNWGWRWSALYNTVTTPDNVVHDHPLYAGISQLEFLQSNNSLQAGELNSFKYEWIAAYWTIGQCNVLLAALDKDIAFSGDADVKKKTLQAWAYWWKGFMYSRVGSMYLAGLIIDDFGQENNQFVTRQEIITEATVNFDAAAALLGSITPEDESYEDVMKSIVMPFNDNTTIVQPDMWVRGINTYKARNILVNTKVADMTPADWTAITNLCANGVQAGDNYFKFGMTASGANDLAGGFYHPNWVCNSSAGWWFVSERLVQEYKPGDARFAKNFSMIANPANWYVNTRNRGYNFGTRYEFVDVESGGTYATANGEGFMPLSPTYEENQLMIAEAKIRSNDLSGLANVDNVRNFQSSGLAAVNGTGLNQTQAIEELRRERRVALALWGLSFYDARRWGVTAPVASGGGRAGAMVMIPFTVYDPENDGISGVYPCLIDYNYVDYWDVPADELAFNQPMEGSPDVKN